MPYGGGGAGSPPVNKTPRKIFQCAADSNFHGGIKHENTFFEGNARHGAGIGSDDNRVRAKHNQQRQRPQRRMIMKRHQLFSWMLGIAVASAIALTGCDDVLGEFQKGLNGSETPAYSIVLSEEEAYVFKSAETELALLVVNTGGEATGTLKAELTGEGSDAFILSKTKLPSIAAGKSGTLVIAPVAGLAAGTYEAAVVLSGEKGIAATLDVSFTVAEASGEDVTVAVSAVPVGHTYAVEVFETDGFEAAVLDADKWAEATDVARRVGMGAARAVTAEVTVPITDLGTGKAFCRIGVFLVAITEKDAGMRVIQTRYLSSMVITGGSATLDWNDMANTPVTGSERPEEPEFYIVTFDGYEQAGEQRRWRGFVGDIIERPIDPTRDGFIFDGWYADASFTTLYKFDSPVTKDTTLYAKWIAVEGEYDGIKR